MRKRALTLLMMVGTLTAQASLTTAPSPKDEGSEYTYLTFETTDGAKTSVDISSLPVTINLDRSTLTIGSQTFALADLSKMYFSTQSETTGIEEISSTTIDDDAVIYDLQGHKVTKAQMKKGVYIVKSNGKTYKMVMR